MTTSFKLFILCCCFVSLSMIGCKDEAPIVVPIEPSIAFDVYGAPSNVSASRIIQNQQGDLLLATGGGISRYSKASSQWTSSLSGSFILDIAKAPNGNLVCAIWGQGLYLSTDNGDTWNAALINADLKDERFFVGTKFELWMTATDAGGLKTAYRSEDNGVTWSKRNTPNGATEQSIQLAFNSADHVFFVTKTGLYRSVDSGRTYRMMSSESDVQKIFINTAGEVFLFIGLEGKISTDSGRFPVDVFLPNNVSEVIQGNDGVIYATVANPAPDNDGSVWKSDDNGKTWDIISTFSRPVTSLVHNSNKLYLASTGFGVLTSDDRVSWYGIGPGFNTVNSIAFDKDDKLLAGSYGIYRTSDGKQWTDLGASHFNTAAISSNSTGIIVQAVEKTLYYSTNNGANWGSAENAEVIQSLLLMPNASVYVGTATNLYRVAIQPPGITPIFSTQSPNVKAIALYGDTTLYCAGTVGGTNFLWRNDSPILTEASLKSVNKGIESKLITSLAINSKGVVYASDGKSLFLSKDKGVSWSSYKIDGLGGGDNVTTIAFDKNDHLYLATRTTILKSKTPLI